MTRARCWISRKLFRLARRVSPAPAPIPQGNTAIGYNALRGGLTTTEGEVMTAHHWIENNTVFCRDTGRIVGPDDPDTPLIIGRVGFRLALRLLWRSIVSVRYAEILSGGASTHSTPCTGKSS